MQNRVAWITGSTTGLGKAMALRLGKAGVAVALNYSNNTARAEAAFADYRAAGCKGILVRGDVTDQADVERMYAQICTELGPVDILVPNATCAQPQKPIEDYDWAFYQSMLDFFIKSPFLLTRACLSHMKKQRWGRIVNIGSEVFLRGVGNFSAYVAAKGGQAGWTRSMATELAPFGITVNLIAPGWIPVERHANDSEEHKQGYLNQIPAKRWGVPEDVAGALAYFAGEESGFVTGQSVAVNGGMTVA